MSPELVNPFDEARPPRREPAPRLDSLAGKTIGLLDISKPGGSIFLDRLEERLREDHGVVEFFRVSKLTFTRRAPEELLDEIASRGCDAVIEALAD